MPPSGTLPPGGIEMLIQQRQQAYLEVCTNIVPDTIFTYYMSKLMPSCNHLFEVKKNLCQQFALTGAWWGQLVVGAATGQ